MRIYVYLVILFQVVLGWISHALFACLAYTEQKVGSEAQAYRIPLQWSRNISGFGLLLTSLMLAVSSYGVYALTMARNRQQLIYTIASGCLAAGFVFLFAASNSEFDEILQTIAEDHTCYAHGDAGHNTATQSAVVVATDCGHGHLRGAMALQMIDAVLLAIGSILFCVYRCKFSDKGTEAAPKVAQQRGGGLAMSDGSEFGDPRLHNRDEETPPPRSDLPQPTEHRQRSDTENSSTAFAPQGYGLGADLEDVNVNVSAAGSYHPSVGVEHNPPAYEAGDTAKGADTGADFGRADGGEFSANSSSYRGGL